MDDSLETEHGLCVYFETGHSNWLLDTGASDKFIRNAQKLGVDLTTVDYVFISHSHADHIGGLPSFLELNPHAKVIVSKNALNHRYFSTRNGLKEIGISFDFTPYLDRFVFVDKFSTFDHNVQVASIASGAYSEPKGNSTLFKDSGHGMEIDNFNHELVISFGTNFLVVYTGCAHHGILNILDTIEKEAEKRVACVIGGFHLLDSSESNLYETDAELKAIAESLKNNYRFTDFFTGHCTGEKVFHVLKTVLEDQVQQFYTGLSYVI